MKDPFLFQKPFFFFLAYPGLLNGSNPRLYGSESSDRSCYKRSILNVECFEEKQFHEELIPLSTEVHLFC